MTDLDRVLRHLVLAKILGDANDKGEFILDNQNEQVLLWSETGYRFVKRQSQTDPNAWIALGDTRPAPATATSR